MFLNIYRKLALAAYSRYGVIRKKNSRKAMEHKRNIGYNLDYAPGSIPVSEISDQLTNAGILSTDTVFVRISLSAGLAFEGGVQAFLKALMDYFTPNGTLVMSSYTFNKSPILFLADNPFFDSKTTTDQLSLVNELFRRTPGVLRSIHPTHSVCAFGKNAKWIVADHHKSEYCYSPNSPFARLYELGAKEISIGVYPTSISFHYIEQFVPKHIPGYQDLDTPIMCRLKINDEEIRKPFKDTDGFAYYRSNYDVFIGTKAQPQKHFFGQNLDFYTLDLPDQLNAMKILVEQKQYWHTEPSKLKNFIFKKIIKPMILKAFFNKKDGILYPVKEPAK
ncbi:AAC(3) family N-acetyltransferase [Maridesulfovibrio ferrireducens]|uniref:AAC(3) family N-acetyltransferase n=1 Tax=Maridesulfovibrio ferrireducens TaxID=246191 RepID=UPI001A32932D|nr:AAC(3) family N-acetyltransferase [Maridesulfovibrio ferrireducens]MBI9112695.1 AAC(3) family N-acetyltransferase [Maridesulfovibrio ferrireducens]